MYRGRCHAMQAGMHIRHAVLARATSNPDQNRPCKPNTVDEWMATQHPVGQEANVTGTLQPATDKQFPLRTSCFPKRGWACPNRWMIPRT